MNMMDSCLNVNKCLSAVMKSEMNGILSTMTQGDGGLEMTH